MAILVENNVAIIVGSMPAVATFVRIYVSESTIIKTLRSKIRLTHDTELSKDPRSSLRKPNLATFGSPNVQRPGNYELTDPTITAAQVIPDEQYLLSRNHTAESHHPNAHPNSTERLV
ncbi:hypothetical protein SLS64_006976 [Diaporthe eres]|uniref:Uncharacterized protein n=1 Tax=Diaporthe eres TaxID=83184 RepID=A0ABR1NZ00_DIAER